jgi:hypothetical protein
VLQELPSPSTTNTQAALAAGHLLTHAALEAFSAARGDRPQASYELLDVQPHELDGSDPLRVAYICEKLHQLLDLLKGHTPQAPWDEVQRLVSERVRSLGQCPRSPSSFLSSSR